MRRVILFMNGQLGLNLLDYLIRREDTKILAVVINSEEKINPEFKSQVSNLIFGAEFEIEILQYSPRIWESAEFNQLLGSETFGISVLFGHIFPGKIISKFNGNLINLHPSLLPIGRGADPIFWSVIEELPQGASIHRIDEGIDTGEILVQEEIEIKSWLSSGQIYELAMAKLYHLFVDFYPYWNSSTPSVPQVGQGTHHQSHELVKIKSQILENSGILFKQLNLIQALTYNDHRKARLVLPNQEIWEVSLHLRKVQG